MSRRSHNCPALLRRAADQHELTAVSWSNLRIDAFAPSNVALDELEYSSKTLPQLRTVPWYGQRHSTRILRWVFTPPPRVRTIATVLEAFNARPRRDGTGP
ncbi:MAG TPA: hypothetical protein VK624_00990 [Steroidobacteraceae bacterium]|nr:hypothetical protein [Steroidobacteraceae bacterium]